MNETDLSTWDGAISFLRAVANSEVDASFGVDMIEAIVTITADRNSAIYEKDRYRRALEEAHAKLWKLAGLCDGAAAIGCGIAIIATEINAALEAPR